MLYVQNLDVLHELMERLMSVEGIRSVNRIDSYRS